ncbi:hypothetical protein TNCT_518371, partial [Trichonephila clavata]
MEDDNREGERVLRCLSDEDLVKSEMCVM